ncbi:MAG: exo-alpha-sialidase, partial [Planctomycetes bacterium]|nr:exo-alpha-sialidase [Planctomycetota bacterium]
MGYGRTEGAPMNDRVLSPEERRLLTRPDYIVYVPKGHEDGAYDRVNEHFLVFNGPDGSLMTIWTQEWQVPGQGNVNHTIFARSTDEGQTWSPPQTIAGPCRVDDPAHMANWAFPMVSKSGRIYVIYNAYHGVKGWIAFHTGTMAGSYSDDLGANWAAPQEIPMPDSPYDDPGCGIP